MSPISTAEVIKTAGQIGELMGAISEAKDRGINSLSAYTKRTLVSSRVYIEDAIATEPLVVGLMKFVNQMYAGMVFCALGLSNIISGTRSVRDMMAPVSTEAFTCIVDLIKKEFGDENVEVKALEDNTPDPKTVDKKPAAASSTPVNEKELKAEAAKLFTGRLMEVTLGTGDNRATIYFFVQTLPYIIPGLVLEEFIANNTEPSAALRSAQWKSGEIKFWKDFVFECDRVEKRKKALKLDKDGILREIEDHRVGGFWKSIKNFFVGSNQVKRNVANSIIIISKAKLDRVCRDLGINMKNYKERQKILADTLSLMMVVYDPNYETVELYLNGIQNRGEYTAQMIQSFSKKEDSVDMKQLLTMIGAGAAPRI